jgi:hypothetical protein
MKRREVSGRQARCHHQKPQNVPSNEQPHKMWAKSDRISLENFERDSCCNEHRFPFDLSIDNTIELFKLRLCPNHFVCTARSMHACVLFTKTFAKWRTHVNRQKCYPLSAARLASSWQMLACSFFFSPRDALAGSPYTQCSDQVLYNITQQGHNPQAAEFHVHNGLTCAQLLSLCVYMCVCVCFREISLMCPRAQHA